MNLYSLLRFLLFRLDPETAHRATLQALRSIHRWHLTRLLAAPRVFCPRRLMGLEFPNPVGLAAGLDKNGEYIEALAALGFGFIEVGTVTPRPQPGNPRPRLFRLPQARAIINRMGFNNKGVDYLVERVKRSRYTGILGINIGKNAATPMESAVDDYLIGLQKVYPHAGYVAVNISSPNTPHLRRLQGESELRRLLEALKTEQSALAASHGKYVPLVIKIAPDLSTSETRRTGSLLLEYRIDGVIATNTSIGREGVSGLCFGGESGGLSGAPLTAKATRVVAELAQVFEGQLPIIAAGGIMSARDAREKFRAGAALIQLYTGLIYSGPALIKSIVDVCGNSIAVENR